jgi:hypothetical protein
LEFIFNQVPRAIYISSYAFQLLFELEETDVSLFNQEIKHHPERFGNLNVGYNNGPLILKRHAHGITPNLEKVDRTCDYSNYLLPENGEKLRAGILLERWCSNAEDDGDTTDENDKDAKGVSLYSNSGVKISRGHEVRLTVSNHGWEDVSDKTIFHGGQDVGTLERRVEDILRTII